jgi:hypothetical protein
LTGKSIVDVNYFIMSEAKRSRGRPALSDEERGVQIHYRVAPSVLSALRKMAVITGEPCGAILARIILKECERVAKKSS